jgi:hypothetical protein
MTKKLSKEEKKRRREERRKSNQQKPKSKTAKTIQQPKQEGPPEEAVNFCDDCAYEFGECDGKPKFASDKDEALTGVEADRVIECPAFVNVANMPTVQEATAGPEESSQEEVTDVVHGGADEVPAEIKKEESEDPTDVPTLDPIRPDPKRFFVEEDWGACPSCGKPFKRTAFNRYQDAIRCTNPRCRAYRAVVKTISTGVK